MIVIKTMGGKEYKIELPENVAKRMLSTNPAYSLPKAEKQDKDAEAKKTRLNAKKTDDSE